MLTGVLPFDRLLNQEMMESRATLQDSALTEGAYDHISGTHRPLSLAPLHPPSCVYCATAEAKDLVRNMLRYDPAERISPSMIVVHPWVKRLCRPRPDLAELMRSKHSRPPTTLVPILTRFCSGAGECPLPSVIDTQVRANVLCTSAKQLKTSC